MDYSHFFLLGGITALAMMFTYDIIVKKGKRRRPETPKREEKELKFANIKPDKYQISLNKISDLGKLTSADFTTSNLTFMSQREGKLFLNEVEILDLTKTEPEFTSKGMETGFMCVCSHPDFQENKKLYLCYTLKNEEPNMAIWMVVYEYIYNGTLRKGKLLFKQAFTTDVHHAGSLAFGKNNILYLSTGDGGPQEDPENHSQRNDSLRGKIIELFPDEDKKPEILAKGLRNPWKISYGFDKLLIGDVGYNKVESIYLIDPKDALFDYFNFGWNVWEGSLRTPFKGNKEVKEYEYDFPIFEYKISNELGRATLGGYQMRSQTRIILGDYTGQMRILEKEGDKWYQVAFNNTKKMLYSLAYNRYANEYYALGVDGIYKVDIMRRDSSLMSLT